MPQSINRTLCLLFAALALCVISRAADTQPAKSPTTSSAGMRLLPNLEYADVDGKSLLLDLYLPDPTDKPAPVILYVHGGAWSGGDKHDRTAVALVAHGYAVASIDYRLSQEAIFPAQIEDCKTAVRWLRAHARFYGLDGAHIGAWGSSAGGHLVALLGTTGGVADLEGPAGNLDQSSRVQAVCDWFGPTDFLKFAEQAKEAGIAGQPDSPKSPMSRLIGGPIQENKDKTEKANPIAYVNKDCPPFLIMHGANDPLVPVAQSEILRDALEKAGVEVKLEVIPGAGHGLGGRAVLASVEAFFDKHLKAANPAPATRPAVGTP
ncbi:MAG TPA: alpha/beta hydrolase [Tepidisphaeraceae bacterium]|jgi:acetyl esterase/lipase|nr:alpha/beta hydrolase [Tepidisphaeraceae bacterium]